MLVAGVPERRESLIVVIPEQGESGEVTPEDESATEDGEPENEQGGRLGRRADLEPCQGRVETRVGRGGDERHEHAGQGRQKDHRPVGGLAQTGERRANDGTERRRADRNRIHRIGAGA
jgi:hypothetical protein